VNIYELEKQATPGRFEHRGEGTVAIAEGNHVFILHSGANGNRFSDAYLAELICHCRNNFMKALKALKGLTVVMPQKEGGCCAYCGQAVRDGFRHGVGCEFESAEQLITELEEVNGAES